MTDLTGPLLPVPSLMLHALPLWFLVLALFLPRIALLGAWYQGILAPFHLDSVLSPALGVILPRALVLFLIYRDQGLDQWFLIHGIMALFVLLAVTQREKTESRAGAMATELPATYRRRPAMRIWQETPRLFRGRASMAVGRTPLAAGRDARRF